MDVSLIIPIYNTSAYLRECLDSVVKQQYASMEAILVNDGSTDDSQLIIDEYCEKYPELFISYQKTNGGLGDARNFGVQYAKGEYLAFLDSDDIFCENAISEMVGYAKEQAADLVNFDFYWYYSEENKEVRSALPREFQVMDHATYLLSNPCAWNKLIRLDLYRKGGFAFPPRLWYEDIATTPAYVNVCEKIVYLRKPLVKYRQRDNSITSKNQYSPRLLEIIEAMDTTNQVMKAGMYHDVIEYLNIFQLCYFASFRFLEFNKTSEYKKCLDYLKQEFPHWKKNAYYQSKPFAFKLYCQLLDAHQFKLAKLLMKLRG